MKQNRSSLFLGLLLILVGGWLIVSQQVPAVREWISENYVWPFWLFGAGILIFVMGLVTGNPGMSIPAAIVAGIGGILYYQDMNNAYGAWYFWMLVPAFVGVGMILAGLLGERTRRNLSHGLRNIITGAVLFLVFGTFFGDLNILGEFGAPILVILLGLWILARGFMPRRQVNHETQ